jgi:hypothetical protein
MFRSSRSIVACLIIALVAGGWAFSRANAQGRQKMSYDPHDLTGNWELPPDGRSIPAAKLVPSVSRSDLEHAAEADAISMRWCRPIGFPADMDSGRPIGIAQGRFETLITFEANSTLRHISYRNEHINPDIYDPSSVGDSIGHWDGDTFVVDTVGFHKTDGRMQIPGGGIRTESSHVVERYRLLEGGNVLSVTFTWTDPKMFQEVYTYEFRYDRLPAQYEERLALGCDPWNPIRNEFVTRTFSPELKKAADAAGVAPGATKR